FVAVVSPVMLSIRAARTFQSADQVLSLTLGALQSSEMRDRALTLNKIVNTSGPYQLNYTTGGGELAERFVHVEQMDILVDRAHRFGPIGTDRFWRGAVELLPSFLVGDKRFISTPSYALWVYGLNEWGKESNATETGFGDAYAYGGFEFVFYSMLIVFGIFFLFFRLFCPVFQDSLFATFVFATYIHAMTEQNVLGLLAITIRELPLELALFWIA